MKKLLSFILFILVIVFSFNSCKKDADPAPDFGYNYFPVQVGRYVVYDVDSVYYNDFFPDPVTHLARVDSFKFRIKEKIQSIFADNEGRPTVRLERYVKYHNDTIPYNQMEWTLRNVWAENKTTTTAEKVEENIRYIKLAFPVKINQLWNGNAQNTLERWDYNYKFFDLSGTIGNIHFDSVLEVSQYDDNNDFLTERRLYTERYARNVGMIQKHVIDIGSQCVNCQTSAQLEAFFAKPILERITYGKRYTMTVNSFGIE